MSEQLIHKFNEWKNKLSITTRLVVKDFKFGGNESCNQYCDVSLSGLNSHDWKHEYIHNVAIVELFTEKETLQAENDKLQAEIKDLNTKLEIALSRSLSYGSELQEVKLENESYKNNYREDWKDNLESLSREDIEKRIVLMHAWVKHHQTSVELSFKREHVFRKENDKLKTIISYVEKHGDLIEMASNWKELKENGE